MGRHSLSSRARVSRAEEAPTDGGLLSRCGSADQEQEQEEEEQEEERLTGPPPASGGRSGETAAPVSTLVSGSSASSRRWEREREMEGRRGESGG